jgi:hypothetical protein
MDIVATRVLHKDGRVYTVRIGAPEPYGDDVVCSWMLVDDTGAVLVAMRSVGVDAVQALSYALVMAGDRLAGDGYRWFEDRPGSGLPVHHRQAGRVSELFEWDG